MKPSLFCRLSGFVLLGLNVLNAQAPVAPPVPIQNPAPPAGAVAPVAPAVPAENPKGKMFFEPKMSGNAIAAYYHKATGMRVVIDPLAATVEANISILLETEVGEQERLRAFEKAVLLNGLAFVPSGPNEVKLINVGAGAPGKDVPIIDDVDEIPDGDNVINYVMRLNYIKPEEAVRLFMKMTQLHPYGSITEVPNASALVLKENSSLIRMFVSLKEKIDVPGDKLATEWFDLENADAETVSEKLQSILDAQKNEQSGAKAARVNAGGDANNMPPGVGAAAGGDAVAGGDGSVPTTIVTDERQNSLCLIGRPSELLFLGKLIERFDAPNKGNNFFERKLRYLSVVDFLSVAETTLSRVEVVSDGSGGAAVGGRPGGRNAGGQGGAGSSRNSAANNRSSSASRGSSNGSSTGLGGGAGGSGGGAQLSDTDFTGAPESLVVGKTLLVADTITNTIIVKGPPQSVREINELLDKIDVSGPQIVISTVFGQLSRSDSMDLGIDWIRTRRGSGGRGLAGSTVSNGGSDSLGPIDDLSPGVIGQPNNPFSLAGLSLYGRISDSWYGYLRAAASKGDFRVLSRPTIYTANNTRAVISSGTRIAVPTSSFQGGVTGQTTNIEYRDVELRLEVVPLVNSKDEVTLDISQLNDQVLDDGIEIDGTLIPTISKQELLTKVRVRNRETVVLGGLITREVTNNRAGVPILSDIPGLGLLFSRTEKSEIQRELMIFIRPEIIMQDSDQKQSQAELNQRYGISGDIYGFDAVPNEIPAGLDETAASPSAKGGNPLPGNGESGLRNNWQRDVLRRR